MGKKKWSKKIVQPDQYEMSFARRLWAHFADLGTIGLLSLSLTSAAAGTVFTVLFTTAEDFWLRPVMMSVRVPALLLLGVSVFSEIVRSMRWTDRRDVFVAVNVLTIVLTFGVFGYMILTHDTLVEQRALYRAAEAQKKSEESLRVWQERSEEEARAADAARKAEEECTKARSSALEIATRRKVDAGAALKRCKDDFAANKTIFTTTTVEAHCKKSRASLAAANEDLRTASALECASASIVTGTSRPRTQ